MQGVIQPKFSSSSCRVTFGHFGLLITRIVVTLKSYFYMLTIFQFCINITIEHKHLFFYCEHTNNFAFHFFGISDIRVL